MRLKQPVLFLYMLMQTQTVPLAKTVVIFIIIIIIIIITIIIIVNIATHLRTLMSLDVFKVNPDTFGCLTQNTSGSLERLFLPL